MDRFVYYGFVNPDACSTFDMISTKILFSPTPIPSANLYVTYISRKTTPFPLKCFCFPQFLENIFLILLFFNGNYFNDYITMALFLSELFWPKMLSFRLVFAITETLLM